TGAQNHVDHAGRRAGLGGQLHELGGGDRGDLAGLDHHGVAGGDGRGRLPGELEQRVVPRRDHAADTHGFVHDLALDAFGGGDDASGVLVGLTSVVTEDAGDVVDVDPALLDGLAGVEGLHD